MAATGSQWALRVVALGLAIGGLAWLVLRANAPTPIQTPPAAEAKAMAPDAAVMTPDAAAAALPAAVLIQADAGAAPSNPMVDPLFIPATKAGPMFAPPPQQSPNHLVPVQPVRLKPLPRDLKLRHDLLGPTPRAAPGPEQAVPKPQQSR
ncbi:MAG: hypothetical protein KC620_19785 [Myxococcales bacterium]|nr:hypothetical protein [Myxococcales bacterium]